MDLLGFQRGNIDHQPFVSWRNSPSQVRKTLIDAENAATNPFVKAEHDHDDLLVKTGMAA